MWFVCEREALLTVCICVVCEEKYIGEKCGQNQDLLRHWLSAACIRLEKKEGIKRQLRGEERREWGKEKVEALEWEWGCETSHLTSRMCSAWREEAELSLLLSLPVSCWRLSQAAAEQHSHVHGVHSKWLCENVQEKNKTKLLMKRNQSCSVKPAVAQTAAQSRRREKIVIRLFIKCKFSYQNRDRFYLQRRHSGRIACLNDSNKPAKWQKRGHMTEVHRPLCQSVTPLWHFLSTWWEQTEKTLIDSFFFIFLYSNRDHWLVLTSLLACLTKEAVNDLGFCICHQPNLRALFHWQRGGEGSAGRLKLYRSQIFHF